MTDQPRPLTQKVDLLIAARRSPVGPGGLAGYQTGLASEFKSRTGGESALCALSGGAMKNVTLLDAVVREPARIWSSLASRPVFHSLLEFWIRASYRRGTGLLLPPRPRVVHFVGTGWDFTGFAMADFARRNRARFTIWPAVHPGLWGDDAIDLRLYRQADAVFCQSEIERRLLVDRGLDPGRLVLCGLPPMCLPSGDGARVRGQLGIGSRPAVLFVGRRSSDKGYPALLEAWKRVIAKVPQAVLLLAGPGGDGPSPVAGDSIRDLGVPDEKTKADALAACDVFALPSAHESFGIVYVEAWSYGKPVICGPAPASRELVSDGVTGLWSEQTPESISASIIRLLGDSELRYTLGESGRRFQLERLTWDITMNTHQKAWDAS